MTTKETIEELKKELHSLGEDVHVVITTHTTPDPDAIGSAMGMEKLISFIAPEVKTTIIYSGEISHSQNRTLVNVLGVTLTHISEIEDIDTFATAYIVVDATPERCFDKKKEVLFCIDHHRNDTKLAKFKDIRPAGATCSIIWEYLNEAGVVLSETDDKDIHLATALVVGIKTDTNDFVSDTRSDIDFEAHKALLEYVDKDDLAKIINYPIPSYFFEIRSQLDKEDNVRVKNGVFIGGVGVIPMTKRDTLPMMAEERARAEGVETAFVFAIVDNHIDVSVRSVSPSVEVNGLCQKLFGKQYAGGKQGASAAKIPLEFLTPYGSEEEVQNCIWNAVKQKMFEQIFKAMT